MAPESGLRRHGFNVDEYLAASHPLAQRLRPLRRRMPWLMACPLSFSAVAHSEINQHVYPAGDALGFLVPFTGSGILNALLTARMAAINPPPTLLTHPFITAPRTLVPPPFILSPI